MLDKFKKKEETGYLDPERADEDLRYVERDLGHLKSRGVTTNDARYNSLLERVVKYVA
jgi:hypothetical protein